MKEQWKTVKDYEGFYEVSNLGEVKSLGRLDSRGHHLKEKLLSPGKTENGYLFVTLYKNGVGKTFKIHRLVYSTFVEEIPEDMQVNHIDEDKENNRVDNLNLMTPKQNSNWGTRNARRAAARSKLVEAVDKITGRVIFTFPSTAEAGRQGLGFNSSHISKCCNGERKSHKGFIWRYIDQ
jgi:hypothetical protein